MWWMQKLTRSGLAPPSVRSCRSDGGRAAAVRGVGRRAAIAPARGCRTKPASCEERTTGGHPSHDLRAITRRLVEKSKYGGGRKTLCGCETAPARRGQIGRQIRRGTPSTRPGRGARSFTGPWCGFRDTRPAPDGRVTSNPPRRLRRRAWLLGQGRVVRRGERRAVSQDDRADGDRLARGRRWRGPRRDRRARCRREVDR
jgi:hypothetical protein